MSTAITTVVEQSAFAKQNMQMAGLFAKRLQDIFNNDLERVSVSGFSSEVCRYLGSMDEKISFLLPNGQSVHCTISTPRNKQ